jgi:hypothetical protein
MPNIEQNFMPNNSQSDIGDFGNYFAWSRQRALQRFQLCLGIHAGLARKFRDQMCWNEIAKLTEER